MAHSAKLRILSDTEKALFKI